MAETVSPLAIVGLGGRFPGKATDPLKLWEMCSEGEDAWTETPSTRFNPEAFYHPDQARSGATNVKGGFFLREDMARFDAPFFNMTKAEAASLDPQQRLLLEGTYEALENAGIPLDQVSGSDMGVFVGSFCFDWAKITLRDPDALPLYHATGSGQAMLANRVSYFFNMHGPSVTMDTACSSSLVALHQACQALRAGECSAAVVAGVNCLLCQDSLGSMSTMGFLSPDGRSYTYDSRANGYGRGEGVAVIVLKRLDRALQEGDAVRAIVRNSGINQDGRTPGITFPSGTAQAALIRRVYAQARLDLAETSYLEAHGTGTQAGDPIEARALHETFGLARAGAGKGPLVVGCVKTNIGHLEGAAGAAGLVKTVLMLEREAILPNAGFRSPNAKIPLAEWNLEVPTRLRPWREVLAPSAMSARGCLPVMRASVNGFGYGGTNAHVILENAADYLNTRGMARSAAVFRHGHSMSLDSTVSTATSASEARTSSVASSASSPPLSPVAESASTKTKVELGPAGAAETKTETAATTEAAEVKIETEAKSESTEPNEPNKPSIPRQDADTTPAEEAETKPAVDAVLSSVRARPEPLSDAAETPRAATDDASKEPSSPTTTRPSTSTSTSTLTSTSTSTSADSQQPAVPKLAVPHLFVLTAADEASGKAQAAQLATYIEERERSGEPRLLEDLAYTLATRRSGLAWKAAVAAASETELRAALSSGVRFQQTAPSSSGKKVRAGWVFTGQGAQWFAMGRELAQTSAAFRASLDRSAAVLASSTLQADWSLDEELLQRDATTTRVNEPAVSQPLCTIVQVALVDMLRAWGLRPSAVVGHSSGEIGAAYAAGLLSHEAAVAAAYFRVPLDSEAAQACRGGMVALACSEAETLALLDGLQRGGRAVIACYNSPQSFTVSGDDAAVDELVDICKERGIRHRKLVVAFAYHSHRMAVAAEDYRRLLQANRTVVQAFDGPQTAGDAQLPAAMFSSVTGAKLAPGALTLDYWVDNLVNPVRFTEALTALCKDGGSGDKMPAVDVLVEVGPHSALSGPIRQILQVDAALGGKIGVLGVLRRNQDATETSQALAAALFARGVAIDVAAVNRDARMSAAFARPLTVPRLLTDLPKYAWNHATAYWGEPRESWRYRMRTHGRHDLLGAPVRFGNPLEPRWRQWIRTAEMPWVRDHRVQGLVVYPAAGYLSMAIEAARQTVTTTAEQGAKIAGYELRDVSLGQALIVPDDTGEVEAQISLRPLAENAQDNSTVWHEFFVYSCSDSTHSSSNPMGTPVTDSWSEHCRGQVAVRWKTEPVAAAEEEGREDSGSGAVTVTVTDMEALRRERARLDAAEKAKTEALCTQDVDLGDLYAYCTAIGLEYGPTFANLTKARSGRSKADDSRHIAGTVTVPDVAAVMPAHYHSPIVVHPGTLDACLHGIMAFRELLQAAIMPVYFGHMYVAAELGQMDAGDALGVYLDVKRSGFRNLNIDLTGWGGGDVASNASPLIRMEGLRMTSLGGSMGGNGSSGLPPKTYFQTAWRPDPALLTPRQFDALCAHLMPAEAENELLRRLDQSSFYMADGALAQIPADRVATLSTKGRKLYGSLQRQRDAVLRVQAEEMERYGAAAVAQRPVHVDDIASWPNATAEERAAQLAELERTATAEGPLLAAVTASMDKIVLGEADPLEVTMKGDVLGRYYALNPRMARQYQQAAVFVDLLAHKNPAMRILEIGAGTGGATLPLLEALGRPNGAHSGAVPRFETYDVTDISSGFFEAVRAKAAPWLSRLRFQRLDVERPPAAQGFGAGTYDLVVAANVLHATRSMARTVAHARSLLRPGGTLLLIELVIVPEQRVATAAVANLFGIFDGWWVAEEAHRQESPLLAESQWDAVLRQNGFSGLDAAVWETADVATHQGSMMISTAVEVGERAGEKDEKAEEKVEGAEKAAEEAVEKTEKAEGAVEEMEATSTAEPAGGEVAVAEEAAVETVVPVAEAGETAETTQSTEAGESAETAEPAATVLSSETSEAAEPVETAVPVVEAQTVEATATTESAETTATVLSTETAELEQPAEKVVVAEAAVPVAETETVESTGTAQPAETAETAETAESAETPATVPSSTETTEAVLAEAAVSAAEAAESTEAVAVTEAAPVEAIIAEESAAETATDAAEVADTVEEVKPTATEVTELTEPTAAAEPTELTGPTEPTAAAEATESAAATEPTVVTEPVQPVVADIKPAATVQSTTQLPRLTSVPAVVLVTDNADNKAWLQHLGQALSPRATPQVFTMHETKEVFTIPAGHAVVFYQTEAETLGAQTAESMEQMRRLFVRPADAPAANVLWLTRGAASGDSAPDFSLVQGLMRTLRVELGGRLVHLDLEAGEAEREEEVATVSRVYARSFAQTGRADEDAIASTTQVELELAVRDGMVQVPRYVEQLATGDYVATRTGRRQVVEAAAVQAGRHLKLEVGQPGLLDSLFFDDDQRQLGPLGDDEIEVAVRAAGVNFHDVMVAMGQIENRSLGIECAGIVTRVGSRVATSSSSSSSSGLRVGDRVAGPGEGTFATRVRMAAWRAQKVPEHMSLASAAGLPIVLCTAVHSLRVAAVAAGETVLVHAAASGLGQALVQLCRQRGATVLATAGSAAKKRWLVERGGVADGHVFGSRDAAFAEAVLQATGGRGVDVVFNVLAGELLHASWRCVAPSGRFIELGKRDLTRHGRLDMAPFLRNVTFAAVDLISLLADRPDYGARLWAETMDLVRRGRAGPSEPLATFALADAVSALRTMQAGRHIGKLVLVVDEEATTTTTTTTAREVTSTASSTVTTVTTTTTTTTTTATTPSPLARVMSPLVPRVRLRPDATYLLVGGLGGIGRALAARMVRELGARHLVLLSRGGITSDVAAAAVADLRAAGAHVLVSNCDVGTAPQLAAALQAAADAGFPAVRGAVHLGLVMESALFGDMQSRAWNRSLWPKVAGTWNLHRQLPRDLDFFVLLSSMVGIIGNPSQAAYGAASAFQDAFARYRRRRGLAATTVDLGMITGIGYVAEHADVHRTLRTHGFEEIGGDECLAIIEAAFAAPPDDEKSKKKAGGAFLDANILTGLGLGRYAGGDVHQPAYLEPRFSHARHLARAAEAEAEAGLQGAEKDGKSASDPDSSATTAQPLRARLRAAESLPGVLLLLEAALRAKIAALLMLPSADDLDVQRPLSQHGLDSLIAVELRNWVASEMEATVPVLEFLGSRTVQSLAGFIARQSRLVKKELLAAE